MIARPWLLALLAGAIGACSARQTPADSPSSFEGMARGVQVVMGTRLSIALRAPRGVDGARLLRRAFTTARDLDTLLSTYNKKSTITRLNQGQLERAPAKLRRFLGVAQRLCRATEGAFDIGVGRLLTASSASERVAARPPANCGAYSLSAESATLASGARLDTGAIGKGYAVDAIVKGLRHAGVERAFIDFGGSSFYGLGKGWRVALEASEPGRLMGGVVLSNRALSSSKSHGPGGPHIVDPRSGARIVEQRMAAVTSSSAAEAEALSTALIVAPEQLETLRARFANARLLVQIEDAPPRGDTDRL